MAADRDQIVSEFIGVTGADEERARFFLQSANWDLHTALETFYDDDSDDVVEQISHPPESKSQELSAADGVKSERTTTTSSEPKVTTGGVARFATISQYQNQSNSSDEEGQAFYAGGSERSGQQILGPADKKKNPTQALFDAAKQHGAEVVAEGEPPSSSKNKFLFKGAGFKLGSDVDPSQQVTASLSLNPQDLLQSPQNVAIKFWKNGFSVDNGPLRDFNDPSNKDFLDSIGRGEVPAELKQQAKNGEVHVNMEDHREQEFVKPKVDLKAFSGAGHVLGSPGLTVVQQAPPVAAASHVPQQPSFKVDDSKPVTTLQIRLSDGTRLVTKFNHDHTVGDIRNLVRNATRNTGNFNLMTTFPNKILDNDALTITDAKLLNAVIVQRMT